MSHYLTGLAAWLVQRLSALYMALFVVVLGVILVQIPALDYLRWRELFANPYIAIASAMFFISLLLHAWVGIRDVVLDYAGFSPALRLILLSLLGGWLIVLGLWTTRILLMVMV